MTQEEIQLVLIDLSARLFYGVICQVDNGAAGLNDGKLVEIDISKELARFDADYYWGDTSIDDVKPYLRPMSSMTTEEEYEYHQIRKRNSDKSLALMDCGDHLQQLLFPIIIGTETIDWLNKKMFDYRGLIPKGLALIAPKGMYKEK